MEKQTLCNHIRVYPDGTLEGHFDLVITHEGDEISRTRHIGTLAPGVSTAEYLVGVNKSLTEDLKVKMPAIDLAIEARIERIALLEHTPDCVAAYKAKVA